MITDKRYETILTHLKDNGVATVNELVERTDSSAATIRRDLTHLESKGKLKRIHGGATIGQMEYEEDYTDKSVKNLTKKIKIAQTAARLIEDGDIIFIDAGTTTYEILPFMEAEDVTVVTNSITMIDQLVRNGYSTHVLGGKVKPSTKAVVGYEVIEKLKTLTFDKCFVGANAIDAERGISTPDSEEAHIKSTAISQSRNPYVLVDSSKFSRTAFVKFAEIEDVDIITDTLEHPFIEKIKETTNIYGGGSR